MKNKKGQLGLNVVKAVFISFLVLAVIGIATIVTLTSIDDSLSSTRTIQGGTVTNESGYVNQTGYTLSESSGLTGFSATINSVYNITGPLLAVGNYTLSGSNLTNASVQTWDEVNITYTYTYTIPSDTVHISGNVSGATAGFFGSTSTIYAILIVVIIILAIAMVIAVISKFGNSGSQF